MSDPAVQMPVSDARDHLGDLVDRAREEGAQTVLTSHGAPAAVIIGFAEYQRLKDAAGEIPEYALPPEIEAIIEEGRAHPERRQPRPRRAARRAG